MTDQSNPAFAPVDLATADLELEGTIYEGFAAAIMVKGQPRMVALFREYADAVQMMALIERSRQATAADADDDEDAETCLACGVVLKDGDQVMNDVSGDVLHVACCGPERESYVKDIGTGEPLGPDDPIPAGYRWGDVAARERGEA